MNPDVRALELAIAHGDTEETTRLLDSRPDLLSVRFSDNIGLTPVMWASRNRHITILELLLQRGASVHDINRVEPNGEGGNSALWFCAQGAAPGNVPIARLLLDYGAVVDQPGEMRTTPFYMAAVWMHMELVQFLLSHGADPFRENAEGRTAVQAIRNHRDWIQSQEKLNEEQKRFSFRAPRMIAFLEKLRAG